MTTQLTHSAVSTQTTVPVGGGRLRAACHRIHLVIQEMNYGAQRVVEVQARPAVDNRSDRR
jgi:hypothetical protein